MASTPRKPPGADSGADVSSIGDIFALVSLLLCTLFALMLFAAVLTDSYGRIALAEAAAAPTSQPSPTTAASPKDGAAQVEPGMVQRAVAAIDRAGIASGLARGVLMVVLFIVSMLLLNAARARSRRRMARSFAWVYAVLAVLLLGLAVIQIDTTPYSARSYFSLLGVTFVFCVFAAVLTAAGDATPYVRIFMAPFAMIGLLHVALLVFSRGITLDLYFLGRLGVFGFVGLVIIGFYYAGQLVEAAK
jgi:hypothetical protein